MFSIRELNKMADLKSLYDKETGHAWNNSNPRYTIEDVVNGVCVNITEKA